MIIGLVLFAVVILFCVSYFLLKKQEIFFTLIPKNEENQAYFQTFGLAYGFLGILGIFIAFFNHKIITLFFLALMLLVSAVFSILFSKKMK
ncbi:hypothetical protein [Enterococcus mediterraneensis]|uniref:hypothetical protein n=1 Tax=Enterococcus mediterraneensis TaxID=2364791 RepID=UPI000F050825|nr:hypothetical protein [Enterococcus mediterraneensis]